MKIKISESDFLVIWDALHTKATIEAVALALKLARARANFVQRRHIHNARYRKEWGDKNV